MSELSKINNYQKEYICFLTKAKNATQQQIYCVENIVPFQERLKELQQLIAKAQQELNNETEC